MNFIRFSINILSCCELRFYLIAGQIIMYINFFMNRKAIQLMTQRRISSNTSGFSIEKGMRCIYYLLFWSSFQEHESSCILGFFTQPHIFYFSYWKNGSGLTDIHSICHIVTSYESVYLILHLNVIQFLTFIRSNRLLLHA